MPHEEMRARIDKIARSVPLFRMYWDHKPFLRKSGIGLPHSTTSRKEWRAIARASVVECGSPMPLWRIYCGIRKPDPRFMERYPILNLDRGGAHRGGCGSNRQRKETRAAFASRLLLGDCSRCVFRE